MDRCGFAHFLKNIIEKGNYSLTAGNPIKSLKGGLVPGFKCNVKTPIHFAVLTEKYAE